MQTERRIGTVPRSVRYLKILLMSYSPYYGEETYDNYNGSYAQDEMGYSDQVIDDAFDGDPDAYWNID